MAMLGLAAGDHIVAGAYNAFVGYGAGATRDLTNATAIGAQARVSASNSLVLGSAGVPMIAGVQPTASSISNHQDTRGCGLARSAGPLAAPARRSYTRSARQSSTLSVASWSVCSSVCRRIASPSMKRQPTLPQVTLRFPTSAHRTADRTVVSASCSGEDRPRHARRGRHLTSPIRSV
jgi:hypothetical protein